MSDEYNEYLKDEVDEELTFADSNLKQIHNSQNHSDVYVYAREYITHLQNAITTIHELEFHKLYPDIKTDELVEGMKYGSDWYDHSLEVYLKSDKIPSDWVPSENIRAVLEPFGFSYIFWNLPNGEEIHWLVQNGIDCELKRREPNRLKRNHD